MGAAEMHERFTDRAKEVLRLAGDEAQRLNHEYIGTEHILIGLVAEGAGVAANVLRVAGADLQSVRREVEKRAPRRSSTAIEGHALPLSPRAKQMLESAAGEAQNLGRHYVGTEHLVLALLRDGGGTVTAVLEALEVVPENVRDDVLSLLGHGK